MGKLTTAKINAIRPQAKQRRYSDGEGLYLQVMPTGSRYWRLAYRWYGKQKTLALGKLPDVTLADARTKRDEARRLLANGTDPAAAKRAAKHAHADTMQALFPLWFQWKSPDWTDKTAATAKARMARFAMPMIGSIPVSKLTAQDVVRIADSLTASGKHETAARVVQMLVSMIDFAVMRGQASHNPLHSLRKYVKKPPVKHHAAMLDPADIGALIRAMRDYSGDAITKAALDLLPLVFTRPGELRLACWSEIDLNNAMWSIPAARTKMRNPLLVPLSTQALAIMTRLQAISGHGELLFPGQRSAQRPISDMTINGALRRLGYSKEQVSAHGFRATARTLLDEVLHYRVEIIEMQLGHTVRDANGTAYNRTQFIDARTEMMQSWSDYLDRLADES